MDASPAARRRSPLDRVPPIVGVAVVCLCFAVALLPRLGRLEFFDGVEHFNLATVQEMRRNEAAGKPGNWMLPTLNGEARVVKPPLAAWVTALLVRPADVEKLSSPYDGARGAAFYHFVLMSRLPTLACSLLLLFGVYALGKAIAGDGRVGLIAVVVCAGSAIYFQQARRATTDLQLALWVTWANAFLAMAVFRGRVVVGCLGAGLALGLASMAKGPHIALLMTLLPLGVFAAVRRFADVRVAVSVAAGSPRRVVVWSVVGGSAIAAVVGLWWYGYVAATVDGIDDTWWREVTRRDAQTGRNVMEPDPWHAYASFLGLMLPWTGWLVLGAFWAARQTASMLKEAKGKRRLRTTAPGFEVLTPSAVYPGERAGARGRASVGADLQNDPAEAPSGDAAPTDVRPLTLTLSPEYGGEGTRPAGLVQPVLLALLLVLVPVLVMSLFSEKKDRYLLPFVPAAAVLAAAAAVRWWDDRTGRDASLSPDDRVAGLVAGLIAFLAAGGTAVHVLLAGATAAKGYTTWDDKPWFTPGSAAAWGAIVVVMLAAGGWLSRKSLLAPMLAVMFVAWVGGEMRLRGRHASAGDPDDRPQRDLARLVWKEWPTAEVYSFDPVTKYGQLNRPGIVLSMYLNRPILDWPPKSPRQAAPRVLVTDSLGPAPAVPEGYRRALAIDLRKGKRYVDVADGG